MKRLEAYRLICEAADALDAMGFPLAADLTRTLASTTLRASLEELKEFGDMLLHTVEVFEQYGEESELSAINTRARQFCAAVLIAIDEEERALAPVPQRKLDKGRS